MEAYDLIEFTSFRSDSIATSPLFANSSQYTDYEQLNTGVFLVDANQDLTNKRIKIPLAVDKFSYKQLNQVLDVDFNEFLPENQLPSVNISSVPVNTDSIVVPVPATASIGLVWNDPVNLITVNASSDNFNYTINNTVFTGNVIEDIAHSAPYNVYFILNESDLGKLQSLSLSDSYKPIVDMILAYNDWYMNPRDLSYKEYPNSSSTTSVTVTSSPIPVTTSATQWV